jgi:hypothetical protein
MSDVKYKFPRYLKGLITIRSEGTLGAEKPDLGDAPDSDNHFGMIMHAYPSQGFLPYLVPAHYPTVCDDGSGSGPFGPVHVLVGITLSNPATTSAIHLNIM